MINPRVLVKITQELHSYVQHNVKKYEDHLLQDGKVDGPAIIEPGQQLNPDFRSPPDVLCASQSYHLGSIAAAALFQDWIHMPPS